MEITQVFKRKYALVLVSIILGASIGMASELPSGDEPDETNIIFLFSGDQAQNIINKLTKAEIRVYRVPGGNLKVIIGTNVICLDRSPPTDEKSVSCRMVVNDHGEAIDVRKAMKNFIENLNNLKDTP